MKNDLIPELVEQKKTKVMPSIFRFYENSFNNQNAIQETRKINAKISRINVCDFSNTGIDDKALVALIDAFCCNSMISGQPRSLNLSGNKITAEGVRLVINKLKGFKHLKKLNLANNQLGDEGVIQVAEMLCDNETLHELNLENNQITQRGTEALAIAITLNKTLRSLNLKNNRVGDQGVEMLANALSFNISITEIIIERNFTRNHREKKDSQTHIEMIDIILQMNKGRVEPDEKTDDEMPFYFSEINSNFVDEVGYPQMHTSRQKLLFAQPQERNNDALFEDFSDAIQDVGVVFAMATIVPMIGLGVYYAFEEAFPIEKNTHQILEKNSEKNNGLSLGVDILKAVGLLTLTILVVPMLLYGYYKSIKQLVAPKESYLSPSTYQNIFNNHSVNRQGKISKEIKPSVVMPIDDRQIELVAF